jgi:hypothetical protein
MINKLYHNKGTFFFKLPALVFPEEAANHSKEP